MRQQIRSWHLPRQSPGTLLEFSARYDAVLRGWWQYFGSFYPAAMDAVFRQVDRALARWARRKYKRLSRHKRRSQQWLAAVARRDSPLFVHWRLWYCNGRTMGAV
jgi:hypothetical protein